MAEEKNHHYPLHHPTEGLIPKQRGGDMKWERSDSRNGLTKIEVIVIIAVVLLLVIWLIPALNTAKYRARSACCNCNLKQIGLGFRQWALDNSDHYPMQVSITNGGCLEYALMGDAAITLGTLSNELNTPRVLVCPTDEARLPALSYTNRIYATNVSYFVGLDAFYTYPSMFMTGDRNITNGTMPPTRLMELTTNSHVGWTSEMHNQQGNVGLADGSVQGFSNARLGNALINTGDLSNRLIIPLE